MGGVDIRKVSFSPRMDFERKGRTRVVATPPLGGDRAMKAKNRFCPRVHTLEDRVVLSFSFPTAPR